MIGDLIDLTDLMKVAHDVTRRYADDFMRDSGRGHAALAAEKRDSIDLEDRWLDETYEAERDGNPFRAKYVLGWAERLAAGQLRGSK